MARLTPRLAPAARVVAAVILIVISFLAGLVSHSAGRFGETVIPSLAFASPLAASVAGASLPATITTSGSCSIGPYRPSTPSATRVAAAEGDGSALGDAAAACHSFAAGMFVVLADGSTKAIDRVAIGDRVRTTDPATGAEVVRTVTQLHRNDDTDMADVVVRDGAGKESTVHTTQHHRFWDDTKAGWVDAGALLTGDRLHTGDTTTVTVVAVRAWDATQWMYDLTVADVHTFYVVTGGDAVLVHNCGGTFLPDEYYANKLDTHAPVQAEPYATNERFFPNGDLKQVTTYDQYGRRAFQYDFGPTARHGEGYHIFDDYGPGTPDGVRSPQFPF